jgi:hypothetical protein
MAARAGPPFCIRCPRQESNLHPTLRRRVLYPLSYEGGVRVVRSVIERQTSSTYAQQIKRSVLSTEE